MAGLTAPVRRSCQPHRRSPASKARRRDDSRREVRSVGVGVELPLHEPRQGRVAEDVDVVHQQRSVAASERRAAVQQRVTVRNGGQHGAAYLAHVGIPGLHPAVERLDVAVFDVEMQSARVDASVQERVEHEGVVRAGRYAQAERHRFCASVMLRAFS